MAVFICQLFLFTIQAQALCHGIKCL
jgi:hypothetical protein